MSNRPSFSEAKPTAGADEPEVQAAPDAMAGNGADLELTPEQRATIVQTLFGPSVARILIIIQHVIRSGQNGDYALWIPLAAMNESLRDLKWELASPEASERFLTLVIRTMREYADRLNAHLLAFTEWHATGATGPRPAFPQWADADTLRMYDETTKAPMATATVNMADVRARLQDVLLDRIDETTLPGAGMDPAKMSEDEVATVVVALTRVIEGWTDDQCMDALTWAMGTGPMPAFIFPATAPPASDVTP